MPMRGQSDADMLKEQMLRQPQEQGQLEPTDPEVNYLTSDQGPFQCGSCSNFLEPSSCSKVTGNIDPEGVCKLFTPLGQDTGSLQPPDDSVDSFER